METLAILINFLSLTLSPVLGMGSMIPNPISPKIILCKAEDRLSIAFIFEWT
jgi:hypothetical protein